MSLVLLRGGGDLATGVALRLVRAGLRMVIAELPEPMAVRRAVSFAEAVYEGEWTVEGITATRVGALAQAVALAARGGVPVLAAPSFDLLSAARFDVVVDARMIKVPPETDASIAPLVVGLGPGFEAGRHCHAVVETKRGHTLGRVYWTGAAQADTSVPDGDPRRALRSPADGPLVARAAIGQVVDAGQRVAEVGGEPITSPFRGVLRGLIRSGCVVTRGVKIGDVDPRGRPEDCWLVSDKALAVGGGVMEAVLTHADLRACLWT
jgi:xanthine dehydrogenase accessory factor